MSWIIHVFLGNLLASNLWYLHLHTTLTRDTENNSNVSNTFTVFTLNPV